LTGLGERERLGRLVAELLRAPGRGIGRTARDGLLIDEELVKPGSQCDLAGSLAALLCPEVELAVLDRDLASIRNEGLGLDRVDVAVLTRLGPAADPEQIRAAKVAVEAAAPKGTLVLDAGDVASRMMAESFAGATILVGRDLAAVEEAALGGAALLVRDGQLVFRSRGRRERVVPLGSSPAVFFGAGIDWLLAAAAAWAMGVAPDTIAVRLPSLVHELGA
jgi:hypothetical protein